MGANVVGPAGLEVGDVFGIGLEIATIGGQRVHRGTTLGCHHLEKALDQPLTAGGLASLTFAGVFHWRSA